MESQNSSPKPLKTLGCHLVELNAALNLKPDLQSQDQEEKEKLAIKRAVVSYIKKRNQCLNLTNITQMLELDQQNTSTKQEKRTIADDLELRAKNRTIYKLKRQGEQYYAFN